MPCLSLPALRALGGALLGLCAFFSAAHACPTTRPAVDIVVAVRDDARPFTWLENGIEPRGFNVELWKRLAEELIVADGQGGTRPVTYEFVTCQQIDQQELLLMSGLIDVVISPLTITAARMGNYDFSQQYISSGLALALPTQNAIDFETAKGILSETLLSRNVGMALIGFLALNLVLAALIRWILFAPSDRHAGGVVGDWIRAMLEAVMRTIGLRGIAEGYNSAPAKIFEIFMAVVGTALSAALLGVLTSAFVGSVGQRQSIDASRMVEMNIATLQCSTAQDLLLEEYGNYRKTLEDTDPRASLIDARMTELDCDILPIKTEITPDERLPGEVVLRDSWSKAMALLNEGSVDAVLGDWVALTYLSRNTYDGRLEVLPSVYRNEPYGWGISPQQTDEFRKQIDRALIAEMRLSEWRSKLEAALGSGSVSPN